MSKLMTRGNHGNRNDASGEEEPNRRVQELYPNQARFVLSGASRGSQSKSIYRLPATTARRNPTARVLMARNVPLGRHIGFAGGKNGLDMEIVGVVKDAKLTDLKEKATRYVFTPVLQDKDPGGVTFFIRTTGEAATVGAMMQQVVSRVDATLPVFNVKTLDEQANETHYIDRMISFLSAAFGLLATLLAAVGLYGVMSYAVARRTREIGIRIALGAPSKDVLWSVMREVLLLSAIGIAVAIPIALGLGRYIQSQLYGLQALDPVTISVCVLLLAGVSSLAGWIPAHRATRVDPITALRYE